MVKQLSGHSDQEHVGYYTGLMSAAPGIGLIIGCKYNKGSLKGNTLTFVMDKQYHGVLFLITSDDARCC